MVHYFQIFCLVCFSGLFGEGPADRRERLRQVIAARGEDTLRKQKVEEEINKKKREEVISYICIFLKHDESGVISPEYNVIRVSLSDGPVPVMCQIW